MATTMRTGRLTAASSNRPIPLHHTFTPHKKMAKLYYSQQRQQYEVAAYNPDTKQVEVIDCDTGLNTLGIRQGFLSDEDEEDNDSEKEE